MKAQIAILLLAGLAFAGNFTADYEYLGYGAQQIAGGENMVGEVLILAGVALIYIAFKKEKGGETNGAG